ncbi:MAG: NAD(P) transhydrogenase subunit alpha [bacterium]
MIIGVLKEYQDNRVSLTPQEVKQLRQREIEVWIEENAGIQAGFDNEEYLQSGAQIKQRDQILQADIILSINRFPELQNFQFKENQWIMGLYNPYDQDLIRVVMEKGLNYVALELIPRISRAQSMDVLSSMATVAGYKAVVLAASYTNKMFPMLTTAGGTITPAKVLVIGAGVAGLQALATAKRLGAMVWVFDPRPATKEQVKSLGGNYIEFTINQPVETKEGYAKELSEEILEQERQILKPYIIQSNIVITTASVPGKKPPLLITTQTVKEMKSGSVIVDITGYNCQLTQLNQIVHFENKTIIGYTNLPSLVAHDSSKLYSRNIFNLILHLSKNTNQLNPNFEDEIDKNVIAVYQNKLVSPKIKRENGDN